MLIITACFLMMLTFSFTKSFGQGTYQYQTNIPVSYWLDLGAGKSSSGFSSVVWDVNAKISDSWFITGRLQGELNSFSSFGFKRGAGIYAYDLLAGRLLNQKFWFIIVSAGFGLVDVVSSATTYNGVYNNSITTIQTVGVPILIQSYLASLQTVDFGICGYINLNTVRCTAGITLNLAIGRIGINNKNY
jgi:hypothetical protein